MEKIHNPRIAALTAALPHISPKHQKQVAMVIRFVELQNIYKQYKNMKSIAIPDIKSSSEGRVKMKSQVLEILGEENAGLMTEFLDKIKGKGINEILPVLMEFKQKLPKDKTFTDQEKELIFEEALSNMPEAEKNKYKSMLKVLKIMP